MPSLSPAPVADPFAVVHGAAEELQTSVGYRYDNATRGDPDRLVIQRTLAGAAFFRDAAGEHFLLRLNVHLLFVVAREKKDQEICITQCDCGAT